MADPIYKVSFYFRSGIRGWTENFYIQSSSPSDVNGRVVAIGKVRALALANTASFQAYTIRPELPVTGPTYFSDDTLTWPVATNPADQQNVAANLALRGNNRHHRTLQVRGLPDVYVYWDTQQDDITLLPAGYDAVYAYGTALKANLALLKVRKSLKEDPSAVKIVGFGPVNNQPEQTLITTATALGGVFPNVDVQVMGCRRTASKANGMRLVTAVPTATTIQIDWPYGNIFEYDAIDIAGSLLRVPVADYFLVLDYNVGNVSTRKAGRAFFVSRGRASNRPH